MGYECLKRCFGALEASFGVLQRLLCACTRVEAENPGARRTDSRPLKQESFLHCIIAGNNEVHQHHNLALSSLEIHVITILTIEVIVVLLPRNQSLTAQTCCGVLLADIMSAKQYSEIWQLVHRVARRGRDCVMKLQQLKQRLHDWLRFNNRLSSN